MPPSRILLILDNPVTTQLIKFPLKRDDHILFITTSPKQALQRLKLDGLPHFIISAIHFSTKMNGFHFCQKLHKSCSVPVLLLVHEADTANLSLMAQVRQYAQAYLTQSSTAALSPSQISTAIHDLEVQHGRFPYPLHPLIAIDDYLSIHFTHRYALIGREQVSLTPTETKLLYILLHHTDQTIITADLLRQLWPYEAASEERLHTNIYRLRKKIEPDHKNPMYILSDWNVGYKFAAVSHAMIPQ